LILKKNEIIIHFDIRFKRGKMYRYESTSWKQTAFADFIENDYQKVKAEIVPPEPSAL
jgi:hypothetical protein